MKTTIVRPNNFHEVTTSIHTTEEGVTIECATVVSTLTGEVLDRTFCVRGTNLEAVTENADTFLDDYYTLMCTKINENSEICYYFRLKL